MRCCWRRHIVVAGVTLLVVAMIPSYIRAFRIVGDSDAPGFVTGDRVLVSLVAYDIRVPYSGHRLLRLTDPRPGDMVLIRLTDGQLVVKRVVAGPRTRIAMKDNHLTIDGVALEYVAVGPQERAAISWGHLGPAVEIERGNGPQVYISFGQGSNHSTFEEHLVPEGHYFVLGSNRDDSIDSRHFGPIGRQRILGKVMGQKGMAG